MLSVAELCDDGNILVFTSENCTIHKSDKVNLGALPSPVGVGERRGNLFYLPSKVGTSSASVKLSSPSLTILGWHSCLGHVGLKPLKALLRKMNVQPSLYNEINVQRCSTCVRAKMHWLNFKSQSGYRANEKGELIHSDVCSFECVSREGFKMWITFIDGFSKEVSVYLMKSKDDSFQCFRHF